MYKSQFLRIYSSLDEEERKRFNSFLSWPLFNTRNQPKQLFAYLEQHLPNWLPIYQAYHAAKGKSKQKLAEDLAKWVGKKSVDAALFPNEAYNDARIRRIMSYGKQLLLEFLNHISQEYEPNQSQKSVNLMRFWLEKGAYELLEKSLAKSRKEQTNTQYRDQEFYFQAFQLEEISNDYMIRTGASRDSYQELSNQFDLYFLLSKLRIFCAMLTREKKYKLSYQYSMMDELCDYIQKNDFQHAPLIRIYYRILKLERGTADANDYEKLRDVLQEYKSYIPPDEMRQIYGFMLNYLIRESRKPQTDRYAETFSLLKNMIKEGFIYVHHHITIPYFNLCVEAALKVKDWEWAEDFIYDNEERLIGKNSQEVFDYSLLNLMFHKKEYEQILKRIDGMKFRDARYGMRQRILKIKCLFEAKYVEDVFRMTDTSKKFLKNHEEITGAMSVYFMNFLRHIERIARIQFNYRNPPENLFQHIASSPTAEKDWLLEKVKSL